MSLCGISQSIQKLEDEAKKLKNIVNSQIDDVTNGITAAIDSLESAVSSQIKAFKNNLESLIPGDLIPDESLQQDFIALKSALKTNLQQRNPVAFAALISDIQSKYTGIDVNGYIDSLIEDFENFDPCKDVPNLQIFDGVEIIKGNPITVPTENAAALIDKALNKTEEELSKSIDLASKTDENITSAMNKLQSNLENGLSIPESSKVKRESEL